MSFCTASSRSFRQATANLNLNCWGLIVLCIFLNIVYLEDQYLKNDTCIIPRKIKKNVSAPSEDIIAPQELNNKKDLFLPDEFY